MISRRSFLSRTGLAAAGASAVAAPHIAKSAEALLTQSGQRPKKIIHIVSDGMSMGTLTCANLYSQLTRKRELSWMQLYKNAAAVTLNRVNSLDSRYWGFVSDSLVRGRPMFVYFSYAPDSAHSFAWLTRIRWNRIGERVD